MSEMSNYRLSDLMQIKYGKDHKHLADGHYPLYGSGGIMRYVEKPLYQSESILIPRKGTLGNLFYLNEPFWSVDTMFYSKINLELAIPKYLYYTLKTFDLASLNVGSAVPSLTTEVLNEVLVSIPNLSTQTAIAEILTSLDDKIELNNRINQELENLTQILYKRWFIDFEFLNKNGEPYKSAGGEMVDSELGEIPKGWDVVLLSELLTIKYGKDHKHLSDGVYPVYGSGGIMRYVERPLYKNNSILIPRKGTLSNLFYIEEPFWSVDTMFYTEIHNPIYGKYLFHYIKILDIASMNVGSAVPSMTKTILNELRILNPNNIALQEYDNVVSGFYNLMNQFKRESAELTNLRNELLPKLISGELEVNQTIN
jgi:type I restriction enzyme S subunit